jgi:hypothetical protein
LLDAGLLSTNSRKKQKIRRYNVQNKNNAAILDNFSLHTPSRARLAIVSGSVISAGNLKVDMGGSGWVDQMGAGQIRPGSMQEGQQMYIITFFIPQLRGL